MLQERYAKERYVHQTITDTNKKNLERLGQATREAHYIDESSLTHHLNLTTSCHKPWDDKDRVDDYLASWHISYSFCLSKSFLNRERYESSFTKAMLALKPVKFIGAVYL